MAHEFDFESYIQSYSGHTKIDRLVFIADSIEELRREALLAAVALVKQTPNTTAYQRIMEKLAHCPSDDGGGSPLAQVDHDWMVEKNRLAAQEREKLEAELTAYQSNHIRESIRVCRC